MSEKETIRFWAKCDHAHREQVQFCADCLAALTVRVRREALDEAAKLVEDRAEEMHQIADRHGAGLGQKFYGDMADAATNHAALIRSLIDKPGEG